MTQTVGLIGGGVIGGGWAARFLLNGWDVRVFDPDPKASASVARMIENARRSYLSLLDIAAPDEGTLSFSSTLAEAVDGVDWVQESVPERLNVKREVMSSLQAVTESVIGSSSSGFKPSVLQCGAIDPTRIVITHPFNPVYLIPLVELVTTPVTSDDALLYAKSVFRSIGMYPLHLKKEVDAHVADRLLEAVWREALWLVRDDIATTQDIDDIIRFGFGLRWAQMGLFETYRIAGGEGGMKSFLSQFGPALKWPWSKLTDVPEFTDVLVDKIVEQSDCQSGGYSIDELERIRDENLVGILRSMKVHDRGAGRVINTFEHDAECKIKIAGDIGQIADLTQPILVLDRTVPLTWLDYNGHMTESRYLEAFGQATDQFMKIMGCNRSYIESGRSYFTVETHIRHLREVCEGDPITVTSQLLMGKGKKLHLFHRMYKDQDEVATGEHFLLHVDLRTRRSSRPGEEITSALARIERAHRCLSYPKVAGAVVRHSTSLEDGAVSG